MTGLRKNNFDFEIETNKKPNRHILTFRLKQTERQKDKKTDFDF